MRHIAPLLLLLAAALFIVPPPGCLADTGLPVWSPLTAFEAAALKNHRAAKSGDPDTLLALALIASGDVRHRKHHRRIRTQIERFLKESGPAIHNQPTVYGKGEKLLDAMHARFFAGGDNGHTNELIKGYDSEQSRVSEIFRTGRFNCISSAILYMVLARYFDLDVQGVVTTHHAFIQIRGEDGRFIEVETTSNQGYGLVHDEAFYKKSFVRFSRSRNLAVPTYADYLKRRVVPPYRLIAENMNHQHTARNRMNDATRQRLYEVMGYLDSESAASQLIRLNTLSNAGARYLGRPNRDQRTKLLDVLESVLAHVKSRPWIRKNNPLEIKEIRERISTIHLMLGHLETDAERFDRAKGQYTQAQRWAETPSLKTQAKIGLYKAAGFKAFQQQQWEGSIRAYRKLLPLFSPSDHQQRTATHENIASAYWNWANAASQKGDWTQAAEYYASAGQWTHDKETLQKATSARARADALHAFRLGQWERAISKFNAALPLQTGENRSAVLNNIGNAYLNWGNNLFKKGAYAKALDKYEAALATLPADGRNLAYNNIAAAYHNMTVPLLRKRKHRKAAALMKTGIDRFPHCAPCREKLNHLDRQAESSR